jgi:hypothetical protein
VTLIDGRSGDMVGQKDLSCAVTAIAGVESVSSVSLFLCFFVSLFVSLFGVIILPKTMRELMQREREGERESRAKKQRA